MVNGMFRLEFLALDCTGSRTLTPRRVRPCHLPHNTLGKQMGLPHQRHLPTPTLLNLGGNKKD